MSIFTEAKTYLSAGFGQKETTQKLVKEGFSEREAIEAIHAILSQEMRTAIISFIGGALVFTLAGYLFIGLGVIGTRIMVLFGVGMVTWIKGGINLVYFLRRKAS